MSVVVIQHRIRWTKKGLFPILPFLLLSLFFVYSLFFFYRLSLLYFSFLILASSIFCLFFSLFILFFPFFLLHIPILLFLFLFLLYLPLFLLSSSCFTNPLLSPTPFTLSPYRSTSLFPILLIALHPSSLSSLSFLYPPLPPSPHMKTTLASSY